VTHGVGWPGRWEAGSLFPLGRRAGRDFGPVLAGHHAAQLASLSTSTHTLLRRGTRCLQRRMSCGNALDGISPIALLPSTRPLACNMRTTPHYLTALPARHYSSSPARGTTAATKPPAGTCGRPRDAQRSAGGRTLRYPRAPCADWHSACVRAGTGRQQAWMAVAGDGTCNLL